MKKLLSLFSFLLVGLSFFAQTIVGTTTESKNVVLEEFTGIHCTYCPDGHAIAQSIQDANPDDVFLINIHTGGYAVPSSGEPDFRTDFGDAIAGQSGLTSYPAGTVNRHLFAGYSQGSGTAMSRSNWSAASNLILAEDAYVNVAVEAEIDIQTRELTVHVEAYYTGDSPESSNYLNVALLQDNTLGPQVGGNMGDEYVHMHRLVYMLTGQWGEEITTTTTGTFVDRTYTYTIPNAYNDVDAILADMKIVAFITETTQEIANGNGCTPSYTGLELQNDAYVREVFVEGTVCGNFAAPTVKVQNLGQNELTELTFEYNINDYVTAEYTWTGSISSLMMEEIQLPEVEFIPIGDNVVTVTVNDDDFNDNNSNTGTLEEATFAANNVDMVLHTDDYGDECSWELKDASGTTLYSGGPYSNYQTINETFELTPGSCYALYVYDSYGDGGGSVSLTDAEGVMFFYNNGDYGAGVTANFFDINSANAPGYNFSIPTINAPIDEDIFIVFDQPVRQLNDDLITDPAFFLTFTASSKVAVPFTATMSENNRIITITPDAILTENTSHQIQIAPGAIETFYDVALSFVVFNFTTGKATSTDLVTNKYSIYPNPASEILNINNVSNSQIEIYNIVGSLVYSAKSLTETTSVDVSSFTPGTYIIKVTNGTEVTTNKFNVVR